MAIVNVKHNVYNPEVKIENGFIFVENSSQYKIEWKDCNSKQILSYDNKFAPVSDGSYYASLYSKECNLETRCLDFYKNKGLIYYPNPVVGNILTIEFGKIMAKVDIYLYNQHGVLLLTKNLENIDKTYFNFSTLPKGIYFAEIVDKGKKMKTIKIVK